MPRAAAPANRCRSAAARPRPPATAPRGPERARSGWAPSWLRSARAPAAGPSGSGWLGRGGMVTIPHAFVVLRRRAAQGRTRRGCAAPGLRETRPRQLGSNASRGSGAPAAQRPGASRRSFEGRPGEPRTVPLRASGTSSEWDACAGSLPAAGPSPQKIRRIPPATEDHSRAAPATCVRQIFTQPRAGTARVGPASKTSARARGAEPHVALAIAKGSRCGRPRSRRCPRCGPPRSGAPASRWSRASSPRPRGGRRRGGGRRRPR
jgi:hypothetical protein